VRGVAIGAAAPEYSAQTLDGTAISLTDLRGRVVLLNIWATWCKPCREEIPALESLHQRHGAEGLDVVGVSIDLSSERPRVEGFARALGATYPLWLDPDDKVSNTFLAIGVPATYLIDRSGTLRWRHMGPITADDTGLNAALASALAERADTP
jgi:peroxiredoxin